MRRLGPVSELANEPMSTALTVARLTSASEEAQ
jgi:hypothetical protein